MRCSSWIESGRRLATAVALLVAAEASAVAGTHDIVIERHMVNVTGRERAGMLINGQLPGPVLRLKEGENAVINVTNRLDENASIHWHGLIVPPEMDGVPGISPGYGDGIRPGETFTYRFKVQQSGTYWFHSHSSGEQEQLGMYAPLIVEPRTPEPFKYDRDYVIMLSDWTDEDPKKIVKNLKADSSWYNFNRQTLVGLIQELSRAPSAEARQAIVDDRITWSQMRMDPTDIADVSGYTFLVNGKSPERNFTALARPGERVRLRFINAATSTYFDVRIPGLKMSVVQADGNNVHPVRVDEFRIAIAETYDVIVQPVEDRAYTIVAESMDRTGFARATLAPRPGMIGQLPPHRPRRLVSMSEMAMNPGPQGHDRGTLRLEQDMPGHVLPPSPMGMSGMENMAPPDNQTTRRPSRSVSPVHGNMPGMERKRGGQPRPKPLKPPAQPSMPGMKHGGATEGSTGNPGPLAASAQMQGMEPGSMPGTRRAPAAVPRRTPALSGVNQTVDRVAEQGAEDLISVKGAGDGGMADPIDHDTGAPPGTKVLSYRDLKALNPYPYKPYDRIIEIRLTGNMQRYFWSINGRKFSEADPIVLRLGERARFRFINETMMNHPMHIHGTWMLPEVGNGMRSPKKHTVNIKPGTTLDVDIPADAEGPWAFHCHLLYHMETGMMRQVNVVRQASASAATAEAAHAREIRATFQERSYIGLRSSTSTSFPDQTLYGAVRFDKLEWNRARGLDSARWDMEAYYGSDYDKFFFKSEGTYDGSAKKFDEARFQALYSRMISYYFDLQVGVRHDVSPKPSRTYAVIGIEGLAPGFFEIDADAYVSQKGEISGTFTGWYDLLITNRLILQPRADVKMQLQSVPELGLGRGITDFELGARLRYEFTRNFAPYIGISWDQKVGETATIAERNQKPTSSVNVVGGVRLFW